MASVKFKTFATKAGPVASRQRHARSCLKSEPYVSYVLYVIKVLALRIGCVQPKMFWKTKNTYQKAASSKIWHIDPHTFHRVYR